MITVEDELKKHIRLQDITAKVARVNLKDTVRVLQALPMILAVLGDRGARSRIDSWLLQSATSYGSPSPLQSKPDDTAVDACWSIYDLLVDEYGEDRLEALYELETDRYHQKQVAGGETPEKA